MNAEYTAATRATSSSGWRGLLLFGDLVALYLFVLVGQLDHDLLPGTNPLWYTLTRALPFIAVWLAAGWLLGAYWLPRDSHTGEAREWQPLLRWLGARALHAWLIAAPAGLLLRALLLERATIPTLFFVATLGFGALFLLAWRLLFGLAYRYQQQRA
ncbi:MAG: DUF3054 domain-containing protein [Anaerolineae bacterium]|nr:DUF3054 domain-containing protein [Anaerolineae bacterium]